MRDLLDDLRHSLRGLRRTPGFAAGVLAILALGLAATTVVFAAFDAVVLRPLPFAEPERLVHVWPERSWFSKRELVAFRERTRALAGVAGYYGWAELSLTGDGPPESLRAAQVTADFFDVLGTAPALGRGFAPGEDAPGAAPVAVLGHELWQRRFAADPGVVGRPIVLDGRPTTVIGVAPPRFTFPENDEVWVPAPLDAADAVDWGSNYLQLVGRLAPGAARATAEAETVRVAAAMWRDLGHPDDPPPVLGLPPLREAVVGDVRPLLLALLVAVGCVLLVVTVDVANLLLTRGAGRRREMAVRLALGAGRGRVLRLLLAESLLLALGGGVLGLVVARVGLRALVAGLPEWVPRTQEIALDGRVVAVALALAATAGVVFGAWPALRVLRRDATGGLREGRGAVASRPRGAALLVAAEVALAFALTAGAGLAAKSLRGLVELDPGFDAAGALAFTPVPAESRYPTWDERRDVYRRILDGVAAAPGVREAGAVHMLPVASQGFNGALLAEGRDPTTAPPIVNWRVVTPGYLAALRIPVLGGRALAEGDRDGAPEVALVNETLARLEWGGADAAVGRRLWHSLEEEGWVEVVGVVRDVRQHGLEHPPRPELYRPLDQVERPVGLTLVVRGDGPAAALTPAVRAAVARVDPEVPLAHVRTMDAVVRDSLREQRLLLALFAGFAALAVVLGAAGIWGVVAFDVRRRVPEIGLRMALGAERGGVVALVVRGGLGPVLLGLAAGLALALAGGRLLTGLLHGIPATDPPTLTAVAVLLAAVATAAVYLPARRAASIDPTTALRDE